MLWLRGFIRSDKTFGSQTDNIRYQTKRVYLDQPLKGYHPIPIDHIIHLLLHFLKPHESAGFTFQMIKQGCQDPELLLTSAPQVRTVVYILLMERRIQMLVQPVAGLEPPMTHVAFPGPAIESPVAGAERAVLLSTPLDLLPSNGAVGIPLADHAVDGLTVKARSLRAGTFLQMVGQATSSGIGDSAEWTGDGGTAMGLRIEMLQRGTSLAIQIIQRVGIPPSEGCSRY